MDIKEELTKLNEKLEKELIERYAEIFAEYQDFLKKTLEDSKFARVHLGFVPDHYIESKNKILIIGRESINWHHKNKDITYSESDVPIITNWSKTKFSELVKGTGTGASFFNFVKKIAKKSGKNGILWGNIYAIDYNGGLPTEKKLGSEMFTSLEKCSEKLLRAQIEILQPEYIIFATGNNGVKTRRKSFPEITYAGKSCIEGLHQYELEEFYFPNKEIKCYRIRHPSSTKKESRKAREELIKLLPNK